jgi:hypothetical protein
MIRNNVVGLRPAAIRALEKKRKKERKKDRKIERKKERKT